MANLAEWVAMLRQEGYGEANAQARLCQDIVLKAISDSALHRNVTVKGGVVMQSITKDVRRATQDIDMDFIHYSLSDAAIDRFLQELDKHSDFHVERTGRIEALRQQDYKGKRVYVIIHDSEGNSIKTKIDFGVHKDFNIEQDEYCFDVCMDDDGASLLINSKEQMLTEKLKSLLKFGPFSTRFKDVFDLSYLVDVVDKNRLQHCFDFYIFGKGDMREHTVADIVRRLEMTFSDKRYRQRRATSRKNWNEMSSDDAFRKIISFLKEMEVD